MKLDELIERVKPKSRKELPFFLLKAAITILIARELFYDISHVRFSEVDMVWLLVYITKVLVFGVVLYITYRKVKKWKKNDRWLASYVFLFSIVFVTPFMNGSIFGMLFVDGHYWGKVIDADTGKPIAGASVAKYMDYESLKYYAQKYKSYLYGIDPKEYFSNPKYAPYIYGRLFGVHLKRFKTNIIKLNKAETDRERKHIVQQISFGDIDPGDEYKVKRLKDLVMSERRKYGLKTY